MAYKNLIVLPVYNRSAIINDVVETILASIHEKSSILVVDDGSEDDTADNLTTYDNVHYLKHGKSIGYGASLIHALEYARNRGYANLLTLDIAIPRAEKVIVPLLTALEEKYSIVNGSRLVPGKKEDNNAEYAVHNIHNIVSEKINNVTGLNLSDAFSPFKGLSLEAVSSMTLEEYDEAFIIQLWIQSAYFGLNIKEITCPEIIVDQINEGDCLENEYQYYLDFIDAEKFLYPIEKVH
jgi:glycosyltransferase involved in cell wall biosynthesis